MGDSKINIICRAYNEGIAFSYEIPVQNSITKIGLDEHIHYCFENDYEVWSTLKRETGVLKLEIKPNNRFTMQISLIKD